MPLMEEANALCWLLVSGASEYTYRLRDRGQSRNNDDRLKSANEPKPCIVNLYGATLFRYHHHVWRAVVHL